MGAHNITFDRFKSSQLSRKHSTDAGWCSTSPPSSKKKQGSLLSICFRKFNFVDAKFDFFKILQFSEFGTFISNGLISSKKCPFWMVDPSLDRRKSEVDLTNIYWYLVAGKTSLKLSRKLVKLMKFLILLKLNEIKEIGIRACE